MHVFEQFGVWGLTRYLHVVAGVAWIGLLWYFNFVQTPAFAEMEASARNNAIDKLVSRALWWFRWAAMATFVLGLLILGSNTDLYFDADSGFWSSAAGLSILIGMILGTTMAANVWMVIWPNQKIVIANARNVQAGGEADPDAAGAARRAALASRMNTIFSIPVVMFMVFTGHLFNDTSHWAFNVDNGKYVIFLIISLVVWAVLELNALGKIGGTAAGGTNVIYDTHQNALITGVALAVVWYVLAEILLRA